MLQADALLKHSSHTTFTAEFMGLVDKARKLHAALEKENTDTLKFYLKQGMQMKNREILKETMEKVAQYQQQIAQQITAAGGSAADASAAAADVLSDKELIVSAAEMLKVLVRCFGWRPTHYTHTLCWLKCVRR